MPTRLVDLVDRAAKLPPAALAAALVLLGLVAFVPNLGRAPFYHLVEGDQALVIKSIVEDGAWVLPKLNADTLPSKPLLFNWLAAIASVVFGGVSEATCRLPSAVVSAFGLAVAFALGRRALGAPAALIGAVFLLTTPVYAKQARDGTTDAVLAFCLSSALALFYVMYDRKDWSGWRKTLFFVAVAGAVLTKGPVGLALPVLVCGAFLAVERDLEPVRRLASGPEKWLVVVLPLAWYGAATALAGPAFVEKHFINENFKRFIGGFGLPKPVTTLIGPSFFEAFPWSFIFGIAVIRIVVTRSWTPGTRFLVCWWAVMLAFFSLSVGKRTIYLLPIYPVMTLVAADQVWRWMQRSPLPAIRREWVGVAAAVVAAVMSIAATRMFTAEKRPNGFSANLDMIQFLVNEHPMMTALIVVVTFVPFVVSLIRLRQGEWAEVPVIWALALIVFYATAFPLMRDHHKQIRSVKEFGLEVAEKVPRDEPLWFYRYGSIELPGYLYFYVDRPVPPAPCRKFPHGCPPGYYLMWQRDWHEQGETASTGATTVVTSAGRSPIPRYAPFVLVRLPVSSEFAALPAARPTLED